MRFFLPTLALFFAAIASIAIAGSVVFIPTATASFTPTDLSGLMAWYDFGDTGNRTIVSNKFSVIADKSGNGNDLSQGTAGQRPDLVTAAQNGLDAAGFVRANTDFMSKATTAGFSSSMTVIAALQITADPDSLGAIEYLVSYGGSGANDTTDLGFNGSLNSPHNTMVYYANGTLRYGSTAVSATNPYVYAAHVDSGSTAFSMYLNDTLENNTATTYAASGTQLRLGSRMDGNHYLSANVLEVIVYSPKLSTSDTTTVHNYLRTKYNF